MIWWIGAVLLSGSLGFIACALLTLARVTDLENEIVRLHRLIHEQERLNLDR